MHDERVELLYSDLKNSEFFAIHGTAEILVDEQKARELWSSIAEPWFPDGPDDPELTIIVVTPIFCNYWQTRQCELIAMRSEDKLNLVGAPDNVGEAVAVNG